MDPKLMFINSLYILGTAFVLCVLLIVVMTVLDALGVVKLPKKEDEE